MGGQFKGCGNTYRRSTDLHYSQRCEVGNFCFRCQAIADRIAELQHDIDTWRKRWKEEQRLRLAAEKIRDCQRTHLTGGTCSCGFGEPQPKGEQREKPRYTRREG